jgi:hypothetical protein
METTTLINLSNLTMTMEDREWHDIHFDYSARERGWRPPCGGPVGTHLAACRAQVIEENTCGE